MVHEGFIFGGIYGGILAVYIYASFALMTLAKKANVSNAWLAFIPFVNYYIMVKTAGKSGWQTLTILLGLIPLLGPIIMLFVMAYFWASIAEKVNKPRWMGTLIVIPIVNLIIMGLLAWKE
ncbi:hypothetical protein BVX95_01725 [archaeon D22]|nr:hypothetical protein BVX95_01725 [archaeon D22]